MPSSYATRKPAIKPAMSKKYAIAVSLKIEAKLLEIPACDTY
jgi:hypothetical protein